MRNQASQLVLPLLIAIATISWNFSGPLVYGQSEHDMTKADVERLTKELSNWGRWGKKDQLGALNLITKAKQALTQVVEQHPQTPWAHIAQQELQIPMGWRWSEQ